MPGGVSNVRPIGAPNCIHSAVAELRRGKPVEIGGVLWSCVSSPLTAPFLPHHYGVTEIAPEFLEGTDAEKRQQKYAQQRKDQQRDGEGHQPRNEQRSQDDRKADAEQDHQNGKHRVDDVVDMGLTLLLLLLELLFTETLTARVLACLLLSGCTHSLFSPLVQLAMRVVHDRTFLDII